MLPVVNAIEAAKVLKIEDSSASPEATVQVAVRVVEQERGLELQVSPPEFTLATMLPVANVIETAIPLKIEALLAKPEPTVQVALIDLNREDFSTKPEVTVNEPLRDLKREVC